MAKREIDAKIKKTLENYLAKISKHYRVDAAYLFGSFANGSQREYSDIDVCIVSSDIQNQFKDMGKLFALTRGIDTRIEPYPFHTDEFNKGNSSFVYEILRTGIPIPINV